jgi:hypothetical protein
MWFSNAYAQGDIYPDGILWYRHKHTLCWYREYLQEKWMFVVLAQHTLCWYSEYIPEK